MVSLRLLCALSSHSIALASSLPDLTGLEARQEQPLLPPCRLNYTTDVWTGCDDVLAQFHISLDDFLYANPELGEACSGFVPGNTYCVYRSEFMFNSDAIPMMPL